MHIQYIHKMMSYAIRNLFIILIISIFLQFSVEDPSLTLEAALHLRDTQGTTVQT